MDTLFYLQTFASEEVQKKREYDIFKMYIKNNGYTLFTIKDVETKIYTPELALILSEKEIPAFDKTLRSDTIINGLDFVDSYGEGFSDGIKYFNREVLVSTDTLYGQNAKSYVEDVHINYFHSQHQTFLFGWVFVKNKFPLIISKAEIKKYGFYAGIVSEVDKMVAKYPQIFDNFYKCELHNPTIDEKIEKAKAKKVTDPEFIKGNIKVTKWYGAHPENWGILDPAINKPNFWFKVYKNGEERIYNAFTYLNYHLENYFIEIDKTSDLKEKMALLKTARFSVEKTIMDDNLDRGYNLDFSRLFQRIGSTEAYIQSQIDFENSAISFVKQSKRKPKEIPKGFDALFVEPEKAEIYLKILQQVEPPVISSTFHYQLGERQKGAIVAWVKALRKKGKLIQIQDDVLSAILNEKIIGLNLGVDGRTLRNEGTTAYTRYYTSFISLIT